MKKLSIYLLLGVAVVIFGLVQPVLAIGPGTGGSKIQVNDEEYGPYSLLVATSPQPVRVGQMSVWVRVTGLEDDRLRRDATVLVKAALRGGNTPVSADGNHKNAGNYYDYVAHLDIEPLGQ